MEIKRLPKSVEKNISKFDKSITKLENTIDELIKHASDNDKMNPNIESLNLVSLYKCHTINKNNY